MTLLTLIRHARSTWNAEGRMQGHADPPLDMVGRAQAQALAQRLKSETFHAIYSSPLARARETSEIIAALHNLPIIFDDRLMERDIGRWTGLTGDEAQERFPEHYTDWRRLGPPGGENQAALMARAAAAFDDIVAACPAQAVAVVSHGGLLNAYLAHLLGLAPERWISFHFENAGLARLHLEEGHVRLLAVGDDRHLENGIGSAVQP
jgi:probable phosphoglycerate mutase